MKLLSLSVLTFLALSQSAHASTIELDVIYTPLQEGVATLSVPVQRDCVNSPESIDVIKCLTPGATLDLGSQREITIEKYTSISGTSGQLTYVDESYSGFMMVNGKKVAVSVTLPTRNNLKYPGTLRLHSDQIFTVVPR